MAYQIVQNHRILVCSTLANGRNNPVVAHGSTVIETQFNIGITDIDGKQHLNKLHF